ncbi:MAG: hypothetical protein R6V85_13165 [Polyangia bacterium]
MLVGAGMTRRCGFAGDSLSELLDLWGDLNSKNRSRVERALATPWCRPATCRIPAELRDELAHASPDPPVGWVLIVSVEPKRSDSASLLAYGEGDYPGLVRESRPLGLGDEAKAACTRARRTVLRGLPLLPPVASLGRPRECVPIRLYVEGSKRPLHDGPSFGLAMLLAEASHLVGVPVPGDVCALAGLGDGDSVSRVGELERKLVIVCRSALGVRRVFVAAGQRDEAEAIVAGLKWDGKILPAKTTADVFDVVFPDLHERMADLCSVDDLDDVARRSFEIALDSPTHVLGWNGARAFAELLLARLPEGHDEARRRLRFAAAIAARHGGVKALIDWPDEAWLGGMHRRVRGLVLAHVVQSAADAGEREAARDYVARASALIPERGEEDDSGLKLLGAVARCRAAYGDLEGALRDLERAVAGWFDSFRGCEASHSLSEMLRVSGLLHWAAKLAEIEKRWVARLTEEVSGDLVSLGFVTFGLGRARLLCGDVERALELLGDASLEWEAAPAHLQATRLRWLARARFAAELGNEEVEAARTAVEERAARRDGGDYRVYANLVTLDRAIEREEDPIPAISALLADENESHEFRLLDDTALPPAERGRRIADGYRY